MERLECKACGCISMIPMDVETEGDELDEEQDQESRFFTCHVCGDNWLSLKQTEPSGSTQITFVHQMGMQPTLKRIAQLASPIVLSEQAVEQWDYFLGDDLVPEDDWREELDRRRFVLKSICTN